MPDKPSLTPEEIIALKRSLESAEKKRRGRTRFKHPLTYVIMAIALDPESGRLVCGLLPCDLVKAVKTPTGRFDLEEEVMAMHMRGGLGPALQVPFSPSAGLVLGDCVNIVLEKTEPAVSP